MIEDHHSGLTGVEVKEALFAAIDAWKRGGCDCCSPCPLEDAYEAMTPEEGEQLRTFGIEIAFAGESIVTYDEKYANAD